MHRCFAFIWGLLFFTTGLAVFAQGEIEAMRYSSVDPGWSARSMGMSGAFSSVGADISSFFTNPAGLAMYKRTSLELGVSHDNHSTQTSYNGDTDKDLRSRLSLGNAAWIATRKPRSYGNVHISYGIAYSKTNNYYQNFTVEGKASTSLMQQFAWQAQGITPDQLYNELPFSAGLAYEVYGIDPNPDDLSGTSYIAATEGECTQRKRIQREGRQNETTVGFAMQYKENFYMGAAVGITGIYFHEVSNYSEKYPAENRVSNWSFDEDLSTFGTGIVARLGGIYRIREIVKVSAAYQTKTITYLQDYYTSSASSSVDTLSYYSESPELVSEYILRSPAQWTLGASVIVGKQGLVSIDWSQSDFRQITMSGDGQNTYEYRAENALFDTLFRRNNQLRVGAEARVFGTYYARGGMSISQSPLSDASKSLNDATWGWSTGIGYRDDHLFADLALSGKTTKNSYYLYDPALVNAAIISDRMVRVLLTIGARF